MTFKSHIDGSSHFFSPESVIDLQHSFQSDIMMPLDICTSYPAPKHQVQTELDQTFRWAKRSKDQWLAKQTKQLLFGIIQGGFWEDCRHTSASQLSSLDLPGYAIGGVSVGIKR